MSDLQIYYYLTESGKNPISNFINSLQPREQTKVDYLLRLLKEYGVQIGMPHAKKIQGTSLWELRIKSKRVIRLFYAAYLQGSFVILHGFVKKTQKTPVKEIRLALRRFKELTN